VKNKIQIINPIEYIALDYKFPFQYISRYYSDNKFTEEKIYRIIDRRISGISIMVKRYKK
jgi:hypothetical protein